MSTSQQTLQTIERLADLPANWDTYGSPAICPAALQAAARLVAAIECDDLPAPHVNPVAGGGIGFTWSNDSRELLVEVLPNGSAEYLTVESNPRTGESQEQEGQLAADFTHLQVLAAWLCNAGGHR
ncbi:MAG TPA: hypothetical protein VE988_25970 [Gemmataceae bacterium]|nr:hypothetical protein [Gemmataceae bacterium]